jgi:hypothetical protein
MRGRTLLAFIALAAWLAAVPAIAHHSFAAEFDENRPVKFTGKITGMRWSNPHSWLYVDVEQDGKVVNWAFETGAGVNSLFRRGWRKEDLPVGATVTVEGWQARNGKPVANSRSVRLSDGRTLFAGTSNRNDPTSRDQ